MTINLDRNSLCNEYSKIVNASTSIPSKDFYPILEFYKLIRNIPESSSVASLCNSVEQRLFSIIRVQARTETATQNSGLQTTAESESQKMQHLLWNEFSKTISAPTFSQTEKFYPTLELYRLIKSPEFVNSALNNPVEQGLISILQEQSQVSRLQLTTECELQNMNRLFLEAQSGKFYFATGPWANEKSVDLAKFKATTGLAILQSMLPLLQTPSDTSFAKFLRKLDDLQDATFEFAGQEFKVSNYAAFLMYTIHRDEKPSLLNGDMEYGTKTLWGEYGASDEDRLRAIKRTIVIVALDHLEKNLDVDAYSQFLLEVLEETKLDGNDRIENFSCVAHRLFHAFYNRHCVARQSQPGLVDPASIGDFGRTAFLSSGNGFDPAVRLAAIKQVLAELKTAWKI